METKRIVGGIHWRVFLAFIEGWQLDARFACSDDRFFDMSRELAHAALSKATEASNA